MSPVYEAFTTVRHIRHCRTVSLLHVSEILHFID